VKPLPVTLVSPPGCTVSGEASAVGAGLVEVAGASQIVDGTVVVEVVDDVEVDDVEVDVVELLLVEEVDDVDPGTVLLVDVVPGVAVTPQTT